ncbi:hypothetical protein COU37_02800 [Candidatus Micrarchaeota archaeon CG10_big_fil_rev_8_21_14_0_10_45_29]|nr:MAG: hypothetical protein COU37_02800 [Candidatus Micrarchaeota archaeon CG10_big_fil_rev_8_21_14_0_10_45_29]
MAKKAPNPPKCAPLHSFSRLPKTSTPLISQKSPPNLSNAHPAAQKSACAPCRTKRHSIHFF